MNLVYSSIQTLNLFKDRNVIKWDGKNVNNEKLSTGVYIYTIKSGNINLVGKFAMIN